MFKLKQNQLIAANQPKLLVNAKWKYLSVVKARKPHLFGNKKSVRVAECGSGYKCGGVR